MSLVAFALVALGFASAPRATAGVEMVEPEYEPVPRYTYVPPPPPAVIYYASPPRDRIYVKPSYAYYHVRPRIHRHRPNHHHHRFNGRRDHWRGGHLR